MGDARDSMTALRPTTVLAPGKLILMGEHAVVYQRPALTTTIDRWLRVHMAPRSEPGVALRLEAMDYHETTTWRALRAYADEIRARWEQYVEAPTPEAFAHMRGNDPAHLVKVALGESDRQLTDAARVPLDITIRSDQPIGAGFGSSAAVAAAMIRAFATLQGIELSNATRHRLVLDVERRQHGTPSGVDTATVLHGGLLWAERNGRGLKHTSLTPASSILNTLRVFHTGRPRESTGTVVDAVRARRDDDPKAFQEALDRMETATRAFRDALVDPNTLPSAAIAPIRQFEAGLELMGVVPDSIQQLIRAVEDQGGAAKISGAGALSGPAAGSLLVIHPDPEANLWDHLDPHLTTSLTPMQLRLGVPGTHESHSYA